MHAAATATGAATATAAAIQLANNNINTAAKVQTSSITRTRAPEQLSGDNSIPTTTAPTTNRECKHWGHRVLAMHAAATATGAATATAAAIQLANNNITNYTYTSTRMPVPVPVPVSIPMSVPVPMPMTMATAMAAADANQLPPLPPTTLMTTANGLFYVERDATTDAYYDRMANGAAVDNSDDDACDAADYDEPVDNGRGRHPAAATAAAFVEDDGDETDSFGSMETVSDNVAVWLEEDGEKHWISGVDANTTCADLIHALLNYQHGQQMFGDNNNNCVSEANARNARSDASNTNGTGNSNSNNNNVGSKAINQSTTNHTKEDCKTKTVATATARATATKPVEQSALLARRPGGMMAAALACEYVIVKQHRHCEEYLDGSAKVFDVLSARDAPARKECELLLRRLAAPSAINTATVTAAATHLNTQVSSLLSTDKDSGMGSPVGSSRSARFRRRKHKSASSSWLAQANTLHPKVSQRGLANSNGNSNGGGGGGNSSSPNANERLLKIILAQDETIHRQLTLLREKERQISKIEEEKHRVRERELGKNYLLETYLNGLDEADVEPDPEEVGDAGVEIFIDEPYHRFPATTTTTTAVTSQLPPPPPVARLKPRQGKQQKMNDDFMSADAATRGLRLPPTVDTAVHDDATAVAAASRKEIEQQLLWLEKIYTLNKQLQREEELLLKLHAKIRKHQVKRAYQTKREVLQQIDKLDAELTLQCCDIRQVEDKLVASNDQLKHKLGVLEALSQEFLATAPGMGNEAEDMADDKCVAMAAIEADDVAIGRENVVAVVRADGERNTSAEIAESEEHLDKHETLIACHHQQAVESSLQQQQLHSQGITATQHLKLSKLQTVHDVLSLQQMIAKSSAETSTSTTETAASTTIVTTALTASPISAATVLEASNAAATTTTTTTSALQSQQQQQQQHQHQQQPQLGVLPHSNYPISCINHAAIHANSNISTAAATPAATPKLFQQAQQQPAQQNTSHISSSYSDKNLLLSLHAHNTKTVKKQMFGPKLLHQAAPTPTPTATTITAAVNAIASPIALGHCHSNNEAHSCAAALLPAPSPLPAPTSAPFVQPMSPLSPLPPPDSTSSSVDISQLGTLV